MKIISMLRGINVSGQKKIKMTDLKMLYEQLGYKNVLTYIQSGNVIFETENTRKTDLKDKIEKAIEKKNNFHVPVLLRTHTEMIEIIRKCPFKSIDLVENGTKVLVTFLSSKPLKSNVKSLMHYVAEPEKLVINDNEAYLYCPNGYGKTKLSNTFIENKLSIIATTRNWKSVLKLSELSKE